LPDFDADALCACRVVDHPTRKDCLMTVSAPDDVSIFAQLSHDAERSQGADVAAGDWTLSRGSTSFGDFAQAVSSLRSGEGADAQITRFAGSPDAFLTGWLAQRHGSTSRADHFVIAIDDLTRIWAARLLSFVESTSSARRSRLNFIHGQSSGGSMSLNYLPLDDLGGTQLHLYNADPRERTEEIGRTVDAVHAGCDFLIQMVGPMEPQSFEKIADRVRRLVRQPGRRLKQVVFVVSPTATRLRPALEALGEELGDSVAALQGNLAQMEQVWNAMLGHLARYVGQHPREFAPVLVDEAAAAAPAAAAPPSEAEMLDAFASSGGVRWVALIERDGAVRALRADAPDAALVSIQAMLQLARADEGEAPADAAPTVGPDSATFFAETVHALTLAQPLRDLPRVLVVQFDKAAIGEPLARLLAARMVAEFDDLQEAPR
jgi:hypothetical protein